MGCTGNEGRMAGTPRATEYAEFLVALDDLAAERREAQLLYASTRTAGPPDFGAASRALTSHVSECVEIALMRRGEALIATPGGIARLSPGQVLVIGYGVHHAELPGDSRRPHRAFWCHLFPDQVILGDSAFDPTRGVISPELRIPSPRQVERIAQDLCSELSARSWGYPRAVFGLLAYLSSLLARRIRRGQIVDQRVRETPALTGREKAWMAVEAALRFCEASFRADISRDDVARAVGYSAGHLGRLVSAHLGHSLSEHLRSLRIAEAKRLLKETDIPVRQIASLLGYADPAHFTRTYTRATGSPPTAFRRETRSSSGDPNG